MVKMITLLCLCIIIVFPLTHLPSRHGFKTNESPLTEKSRRVDATRHSTRKENSEVGEKVKKNNKR